MNIIATRIKIKEAEPGDLLSSYGQKYWDGFIAGENLKPGDLGASVFIRSNQSPEDKRILEQNVYRLKIIKR